MHQHMVIEHEHIAPILIRPDCPTVAITLFDREAAFRFRQMSIEYSEQCLLRPAWNRCTIALAIGAKTFGAPVSRLQSRDVRCAVIRQQLMAFSRVVSEGTESVNSWMAIGRAFHRHHSTVIYAVDRYGIALQRALEKPHA